MLTSVLKLNNHVGTSLCGLLRYKDHTLNKPESKHIRNFSMTAVCFYKNFHVEDHLFLIVTSFGAPETL